jgi:hypothetical protein
MIPLIKQFNARMLNQLNQLIRTVNGLDNMRGDGFISTKRTATGTTIGLNSNAVREKFSRTRQDTGARKIFQVRSFATPRTLDGGVTYSTRLGIYNCVEMFVNDKQLASFPFAGNTGWEGSDLLLNNEPSRISDATGKTPYLAKTNWSGTYTDYEEWGATETYTEGDIVEVTQTYTISNGPIGKNKVVRTYRAKATSTKKIPADNPDLWEDLTVEVLNLSESYMQAGLESGWPKICKFDLITASEWLDNTNVRRWAGYDNVGQCKAFLATGDVDAPSQPICDAVYGGLNTTNGIYATEGEPNYNVTINNPVDGVLDWETITNQWILAAWYVGAWHMHPVFATYAGGGLKHNKTTLEAKVDGTTIGINGSGELYVI